MRPNSQTQQTTHLCSNMVPRRILNRAMTSGDRNTTEFQVVTFWKAMMTTEVCKDLYWQQKTRLQETTINQVYRQT